MSKIASIVMLHQDLEIRTTCQSCTNEHLKDVTFNEHLKDVIFGAGDAACKEIIGSTHGATISFKAADSGIRQIRIAAYKWALRFTRQ